MEATGNQSNTLSNKAIYFPELDGLRFFAFLLVFLHHHELLSKIPVFSSIYENGWIGVDLFFTLSAFLFTYLLIEEFNRTRTISFRKFYLRRVFRIFPVYYFIVFVSLLWHFFSGSEINKLIWIRLLGLLSFTDNLLSARIGPNILPFVSHLWTIAYEEQFYLFIPLFIYSICRVKPSNKLKLVAVIFLVFSAIRIGFIRNEISHPAIWVLPFTHFDSILIGIVIGIIYKKFKISQFYTYFLLALSLTSFAIICLLPNIRFIDYHLIAIYTLSSLFSGGILIYSLSDSNARKFLSHPLLVFLGKRSYGLYLYHLLGNVIGIYVTQKLSLNSGELLTSFLISFSCTILISVTSYRFIEIPFLMLKKKYEIVKTRPI